MLIQPGSSQPGLPRGITCVLLENSIITEHHKWIGMIYQLLYVSNCIEGDWYTLQRSQTTPQKLFQTKIESACPYTWKPWHPGSMASRA
ncbi:hypothetical protein TNCV_949621 [Trichonephila clavipes]|nr:hypothetical protein TNCV_949621 [Trichonephila clavipes]